MTQLTISMPMGGRELETYTLRAPLELPTPTTPPTFNRVAYSAAHVVADPFATTNPWLRASIELDTRRGISTIRCGDSSRRAIR